MAIFTKQASLICKISIRLLTFRSIRKAPCFVNYSHVLLLLKEGADTLSYMRWAQIQFPSRKLLRKTALIVLGYS